MVDRYHGQYAGRLSFEDVLRHVRQGQGVSGRNPDYVRNTYDHLIGMNVVDPLLHKIVDALDQEA